MADQHAVLAVVRVHGRDQDLFLFQGTWGAAQAVFTALDNEARDPEKLLRAVEPMELRFFAVRSMDDPRAAKAYRFGQPSFYMADSERARAQTYALLERKASQAYREYRRKAIGGFATKAVNDESLPTLGHVMKRVVEDATFHGIELEKWDVQDAVKRRVTLGREYNPYRARTNQPRNAYFFPKKLGKLDDFRVNDQRLFQTTLALNAPFYRLTKEALVG